MEKITDKILEDEIWKPLTDYEGDYEISNMGNVRSNMRSLKKNRILKSSWASSIYPRISLRKNGEYKLVLTHRLVALAFLPNPLNKRTVNHKNGIKTDNRAVNLEWSTDSENMQHAHNSGLFVTDSYNRKKGRVIYWLKQINPNITFDKVRKIFHVSETVLKKIYLKLEVIEEIKRRMPDTAEKWDNLKRTGMSKDKRIGYDQALDDFTKILNEII